MNTASQVPSGVFTWTLVSTTGSPAAEAEPAAATRPAPTDKATKSRRDRSPDESLPFSLSSRLSSIATSSGNRTITLLDSRRNFSNAAAQISLLHGVRCQSHRPPVCLNCFVLAAHSPQNVSARRMIEIIQFQFCALAEPIDQYQAFFKSFTHRDSHSVIQRYDGRRIQSCQFPVQGRNLPPIG